MSSCGSKTGMSGGALVTTWQSDGNPQRLKTFVEAGETQSEWLERHQRAVEGMQLEFPEDPC